jgi:glycerate-2-kinase
VTGGRTRARLERIFRAGVASADPGRALGRALRRREDGALELDDEFLSPGTSLHVLAAGKAASGMAHALAEIAGADVAAGCVVTPAGQGSAPGGWALHEGSHPVPDERSAQAGRAALRFAGRVPPDAVLLVLLSGGASSLLSTPADGLSWQDLASATRLLLAAGAPIDELNTVRKHLSALAGGRLALVTPARRVRVLALSDVAGDRIDVIGSGPCSADPTRYVDALDVLARRGLTSEVPAGVRAELEAGARGQRPETPKAGDPSLARVRHRVLASNETALRGAWRAAEDEGLAPVVVSRELRGEARRVGDRLGALCRAVRGGVCLLAGGETTVTVRGGGRGGRSQELALAAALRLVGAPAAALLAGGTDGIDGPTDAAGAFVDGGTVARATAAGLDPRAALADNDAYGLFAREGGLLVTGPTGTNVRDLVIATGGG